MTEFDIRFCARCDASLGRQARVCGQCGTPTREEIRERQHAKARQLRDDQRRGLAITLVFVGTLLALFVPEQPDLTGSLVGLTLDAIIGAVALAILGTNSWRLCLGRWPTAPEWLCAAPVAAVAFALSLAYVALLSTMLSSGTDAAQELPLSNQPLLLTLFVWAIVPGIVEEWLCRGVLWFAIRPVASRGVTIVATAVLFSLLHGLNGGFVLEFPHRFAAGLLFGWLRAHTASVGPCMLAHVLHNAAAILV